MNHALRTVDEMAAALTEEKSAKGRKSLYKQQTDEHKGELLKADIAAKVTALRVSDERPRVDWADLEQVKARTYDYFEACQQSEVYPSVMGLATYGYGVTPGSKEFTANNYYTGEDIVIPLDPTLTPSENAKKYFEN